MISLDRALDLEPENSDALGNRAVARTALGQDELAESDITKAIELGAPPDGIHAVVEYVKQRRRPQDVRQGIESGFNPSQNRQGRERRR